MLRYAITTLLCGAGLLSSAPSATATPTPTSPPAPPPTAPAPASCSACSPDGSYICEGGYCFANGSIVANRERNLLRSFGPGAVFLNRCATAGCALAVLLCLCCCCSRGCTPARYT